MTLTERNKMIEKKVKCYIDNIGLGGKLKLDPIPNICKKRRHYYKSEDCCYFTAYMWQMNKLCDDELNEDIVNRVQAARKYFKL